MTLPTVSVVRLCPYRWTPIPETNLIVLLDDDQEFPVYQWDGIWDLSPLAWPGRVLAWAAFTDEPGARPWPLLPPARRTCYHSEGGQ